MSNQQMQQKKDLRKMVVDTLNRRIDGFNEFFVAYGEEHLAAYRQVVIEISGEDVIVHFALGCRAKIIADVLKALNGFHPVIGNWTFVTGRNDEWQYQIFWDDEAVVEYANQVQRNAKIAQDQIDHQRKMDQLKSSENEKDIEF